MDNCYEYRCFWDDLERESIMNLAKRQTQIFGYCLIELMPIEVTPYPTK